MKGRRKHRMMALTGSLILSVCSCLTTFAAEQADTEANKTTEQQKMEDSEPETEALSSTACESLSETEGQSESETETETEAVIVAHKIKDFSIVYQMPELPTGCEITAMDMVLKYYGYDISKEELALNYLPRTELSYHTGSDGRTYGPDMEQYFVGNPAGSGIICGSPAVETAVNKYFETIEARHTAIATKNISTKRLFEYINKDKPVVIWCTIGMEDRQSTQGWYTDDGRYMEWSHNDHGAVLIGYDQDNVYIADPIAGNVTCSRQHFEDIFTRRRRQCVILEELTENSKSGL